MSKIYKFEPHYFERVWGGRTLEKILHRQIPIGLKIGESWELVDRDDCLSKLIQPAKGQTTIRELLDLNSGKIMGPGWDKKKRFPILVKWLDCSKRLSLQVHPPSLLAKSFSGEPKTENWYIAHAEKNAGLFVGLKKDTSKKDFIQALEDENLESVCHWIKSEIGDSILVESGRIHAIDEGNLILEIQQNSDTTFRVYDWGRKDTNGVPRKLHVKESLQCIDFNDFEPETHNTDESFCEVIANCEHFRIRKFSGNENQVIMLKKIKEQCMILNPIGTDISVGNTIIQAGSLGLSPYAEDCMVKFKNRGKLILTDNFFIP